MPRLPTSLIARAYKIDSLLPLLLRPCRDLRSAQNELRWLKEHALETARQRSEDAITGWRTYLKKLCHERALGRPLQYLLGSEYFGDLEIACRPGVLIPRQETAAYVTHLVQALQERAKAGGLQKELRVLDLCTGSGCIPLLLQHQFYDDPAARSMQLRVVGADLSRHAVALSEYNRQRLLKQQLSELRDLETKPRRSKLEENRRVALRDARIPALKNMEFVQADVLTHSSDESSSRIPSLMDVLHRREATQWDILICNPPYISPAAFNQTTARSVRNYEPKLALVPPQLTTTTSDESRGDLFYPRLYAIADEIQAKVALFEVADLEQAVRVAHLARGSGRWERVEIWRDDPAGMPHGEESRTADGFVVRGRSNGRSVFCTRGDAVSWVV